MTAKSAYAPGCRPGERRPPDRLFPGYAFDLDGTLYLGDTALPRAIESLNRLRRVGCRVVFVTNKSLESPADYALK